MGTNLQTCTNDTDTRKKGIFEFRWIRLNKKHHPHLCPLFSPCFLQFFVTLPLVHVQIWLNPASSAPISWSSGCCETCRELQLFSPQTLLTNNLAPSKMKSNFKTKKKTLFLSSLSSSYELASSSSDLDISWGSPTALAISKLFTAKSLSFAVER